MEMAAKICQVVINRSELLLKFAANLPGCVGCRVGGIRFDQIDDRFRLCQCQFSVQECPLGKFAPLGRFCACDSS